MTFSPAELAKQDFFFGYLADYLDGELPADLASRFADALKDGAAADAPQRFQTMRGKLQLAMQSYYLKEGEQHELHTYVQDPALQETEEKARIEQLGRGFLVSMLMRRIILAALVLAAGGFLWWKYGVSHEQKFKPLEYLGYEALAIEDDASERINLPSRDLNEIKQYLATYPGLAFKPRVLRELPGSWEPAGASVIDYEIAKVSVVMYENAASKEKLFHFSFGGQLADLPKATSVNMRGLVFQPYTSNELNFIAWQSAADVVSLLAGRRSVPELAELAVAGSGKN